MRAEADAPAQWAYSRVRLPNPEKVMVLCPVAMAVGCRKCPVFNLCPAKGLIGDHVADAAPTKSMAPKKK